MSSAIRVIESANVAAGFSLNACLLFLISYCSKPQLGNYRTLLKVFACYDIFMVLLHVIVRPASYTSGSAFGAFSRNFPENENMPGLCSSGITLAFTLMNINFLHRFWSVRGTHRVVLFSKPAFLFLCFLYPIIMSFLWHCACMSLAHNTIGKEILRRSISELQSFTVTDGWLILHYWESGVLHVRGLVTLLCGGSIIVVNLAIGAILFARTVHCLRTAHTLSPAYTSYQFKILRALLAQSAIPTVFVYVPAGVAVSLPLFVTHERRGAPLDPWFTIISVFPALDAVVIISLMKDYREGLMAMICRRRGAKVMASDQTISQTIGNARL